MDDLLDRVEAKGIEIGEARGRQEGRQEGHREGVDETRLESIKNIMKNLKLTVEQAMEALGIPASDQPKYLAKL